MTHSQTEGQVSDLTMRLKYCKRLPTLPAVALRLVELAGDDTATLDQFAEQITFDPALAGKLLRVANSSFYGHRRTISNLSQAMGLLGLNATIALSLSFSLRECLTTQQHSAGFDVSAYWRRALLMALACRTIAAELDEPQPEDFLFAGLLQDIGVLAMDAMFGEPYAALYRKSLNHKDLLAQEAVRFGFSHAQAGAHLLKIWGLPDRLCESAWLSHETLMLSHENLTQDGGRLPLYVAAAELIADAWLREQSTPDSLETAHDGVYKLLAISLEQHREIISTMVQKIPEMEALFETQLVDPQMMRGVEESARELLAVRNLQLSQDASPATQTQALEARIAALETQTQRDSLTGLFNRSHLDMTLQQEFERATRERSPLSVAFIDVDRFKAINDTFGHAIGDQVLASVAQRLQGEARQKDMVARYGGEEFVVILTDTGTFNATTVVQRMLASVRDTPFHTRSGASGTVTFSAGIATHMEGTAYFQTAQALLHAADDALYRAKDRGRECIVVYQQGGREVRYSVEDLPS